VATRVVAATWRSRSAAFFGGLLGAFGGCFGVARGFDGRFGRLFSLFRGVFE